MVDRPRVGLGETENVRVRVDRLTVSEDDEGSVLVKPVTLGGDDCKLDIMLVNADVEGAGATGLVAAGVAVAGRIGAILTPFLHMLTES